MTESPLDAGYEPRRRGEFIVRADAVQLTRCRFCRALVVFHRIPGSDPNAGPMILDWRTRQSRGNRKGRSVLGLVSHFATCPRADEVRSAKALERAIAKRRGERRAGVQELPFPEPERREYD